MIIKSKNSIYKKKTYTLDLSFTEREIIKQALSYDAQKQSI